MSKLHWMCAEPECEQPKQGTLAFCATHLSEQRKEHRESLKPIKKPKLLKRTPVKKVSDKRKDQNDAYSVMRDNFLAEHKICEVCNESRATEVHHKKGRENELLLDMQYWLPTCRTCHALITEDSAFAIREGYSLPRNAKQETI